MYEKIKLVRIISSEKHMYEMLIDYDYFNKCKENTKYLGSVLEEDIYEQIVIKLADIYNEKQKWDENIFITILDKLSEEDKESNKVKFIVNIKKYAEYDNQKGIDLINLLITNLNDISFTVINEFIQSAKAAERLSSFINSGDNLIHIL